MAFDVPFVYENLQHQVEEFILWKTEELENSLLFPSMLFESIFPT